MIFSLPKDAEESSCIWEGGTEFSQFLTTDGDGVLVSYKNFTLKDLIRLTSTKRY